MWVYFIKVQICWAICWLLYAFLLRRHTFFAANRAYLLFAVSAGIGLPLLSAVLPAAELLPTAIPIHYLPTFTVTAKPAPSETYATGWLWQHKTLFAYAIYGMGSVWSVLTIIIGLWQLHRLRQNANIEHFEGCAVVQTQRQHPPFSFGNTIYMSRHTQVSPAERILILRHEWTHCRQHHTADILFLQLLQIVFWWSPLLYLYRHELRLVHEYLADEGALRQPTYDVQTYGHLLLGQVQGTTLSMLTLHHSFITSQLKNRIIMMTKPASSPWALATYAAVVPVLVALLVGLQTPRLLAQNPHLTPQQRIWAWQEQTKLSAGDYARFAEQGSTSTDTIVTIDPTTFSESVKIVQSKNELEKDAQGRPIHTQVDEYPIHPHCIKVATDAQRCTQDRIMEFLGKNVTYPEQAKSVGQEGMVLVTYVITAKGKLTDVGATFKTKDGAYLNNASVEAVCAEAERVVKAIGEQGTWQAATRNGKVVNCRMVLPIKFKLD